MIQTAQHLSGIKNKTIILTGAIKPEKFKDSDAEFNMGFALGALSIAEPGIYIAMNGRLFNYDKVKRNSVSGNFIDL
jgi:L-asparaginase